MKIGCKCYFACYFRLFSENPNWRELQLYLRDIELLFVLISCTSSRYHISMVHERCMHWHFISYDDFWQQICEAFINIFTYKFIRRVDFYLVLILEQLFASIIFINNYSTFANRNFSFQDFQYFFLSLKIIDIWVALLDKNCAKTFATWLQRKRSLFSNTPNWMYHISPKNETKILNQIKESAHNVESICVIPIDTLNISHIKIAIWNSASASNTLFIKNIQNVMTKFRALHLKCNLQTKTARAKFIRPNRD